MGKVLALTDLNKRIELFYGDWEMGIEVSYNNSIIKVKYEDLGYMKNAIIDVKRWGFNYSIHLVKTYMNQEAERIRRGLLKVMRRWGLSS